MCEKNFDGKTQLTPLRGQRYNIDVNLFRGEVKVLTGGDARLGDKSTSLAGPNGWESRTDGIVRMKETQDTLCIL